MSSLQVAVPSGLSRVWFVFRCSDVVTLRFRSILVDPQIECIPAWTDVQFGQTVQPRLRVGCERFALRRLTCGLRIGPHSENKNVWIHIHISTRKRSFGQIVSAELLVNSLNTRCSWVVALWFVFGESVSGYRLSWLTAFVKFLSLSARVPR
jgi:hypothetical protein